MTDRPEDDGQRLAGRVLGRVVHDLNNIAMVWAGHLDLIRGGHEELSEAYAAFDSALEHLARLTAGLKDFALAGADPPEEVDINQVVREAAPATGRPPVQLALDPAALLLPGRRDDLARAVAALIANACEAGPPDSRVRVRTRLAPESRSVLIEVEDSGPGVAAEVKRRDFEPLVSTRGQRGRGLGLSLTRLVALQHGGALTIEGRPQGGTLVRLSLSAR